MSRGRIILLVLMAVAMLAVAVLTWGSIGSIAMVFCLILMVLSLLWQKAMTNRDDDYFQTE